MMLGGVELSLYQFMRQSVKLFLENKYIEKLITYMTLFLCVAIFSELSIADFLETSEGSRTELGQLYYYINYFLLTFFVVEIVLKTFAYGFMFFTECINVFDSIIVFISYVFLVLDLKVKFISLLRILRLIKVITEMKRVADANKIKQENIKQQKKQSSQMASYVERVIDFLERQTNNSDIPKMLVEDI
mmetsp:Transcript_39713/g.60860  ORF Transcript_39713/g.60860 Transcript_39713/m.60860 type:complete len:189 (+) Transcript_39713:1157-1723(+)